MCPYQGDVLSKDLKRGSLKEGVLPITLIQLKYFFIFINELDFFLLQVFLYKLTSYVRVVDIVVVFVLFFHLQSTFAYIHVTYKLMIVLVFLFIRFALNFFFNFILLLIVFFIAFTAIFLFIYFFWQTLKLINLFLFFFSYFKLIQFIEY